MALTPLTFMAGAGWGAGRNRLHHYQTADDVTVMNASGYFNSVAKQLVNGDQIIATCLITAVASTVMLVVTSATAATPVTVTQAP